MGVPPNHPFIDGFSMKSTIHFGVPPMAMETPIELMDFPFPQEESPLGPSQEESRRRRRRQRRHGKFHRLTERRASPGKALKYIPGLVKHTKSD